jgi:hypothetical protein
MTGGRWVSVGRSSDPNPAVAGCEAVAGAVAGEDPKLLVVFASEAYYLRALLAAVREEAPGVALIGCSTAGEIAASGPGDSSVVITGFGGPGFSAATGVGRNASTAPREAGAGAAGAIRRLDDREHRVLIILSDGLAGRQQEIVRGAYGEVGAAVPLVGGCAGDDMQMQATHQLYEGEVLSDGVVAAALGSDSPIGIGVRHGWRRVGDSMLITSSADSRVLTIDNRPALDAYLERLGAPAEAHRDPAAFTQFAQTHPLGLARRRGEEAVRFVGEADFQERALVCIAEVPQGSIAWFMEGDDESVLNATDAACADALASLDGAPPLGLVAFDCIARRGVLGDEGVAQEIERVAGTAPGAAVAGFYTYGEIARTHGVAGFHNQTLVVLAVS